MQYLEVSGAVRPLKWPLGVKWLIKETLRNILSHNTVIYLESSPCVKVIIIKKAFVFLSF
jgi:hypothetical protein